MATKVQVNGKSTSRAGVFASIKSAIRNTSQPTSYGNVLIIDDGLGAGFGGGSGNTVYEFESLEAFQAFVKGGEIWNIAKPLFNPASGQKGISKLYFASARTATPAVISLGLVNGSFDIRTKDTGLNANGILSGANLIKGYAGKLVKTPSAKFKFQIWHGSYTGLDAVNNVPYDGIIIPDSKPQLVVESPEVLFISDLILWFQNNTTFGAGFELTAAASTGNFVDADITEFPSYILAGGATEVYNASDLDAVLTKINNQDYTHILALKNGDDGDGANNDKLFDFVINKSKYDRILFIGGGEDKEGRIISKTLSAHFDHPKVNVVHGGVKKKGRTVSGFNVFSSLYHAANILGRGAGLPPQVPVTIKSIGIDGLMDTLEDDDIEELIKAGLMHSYFDTELDGVFVIGLDVNTLQKNEFLINNDGTTYSWQLKRIEADLNKSIITNGKKRFFDPNGQSGNRNTISETEVVEWAKQHLESRKASDKRDDLIISFTNVQASINQDNISLTYDFVPNSEIKTIVATGTMIEG